jgi:hypothetical protein
MGRWSGFTEPTRTAPAVLATAGGIGVFRQRVNLGRRGAGLALFVAEHRHSADRCPASSPQMAPLLLELLSAREAAKRGVRIHGEAVARAQHHLYLVLDGPDERAVRTWLAPFAQAGSLDVLPASHCEEVVARGEC